MILIAPLQQAASWFPELMNLSQEDPIPLFVEGQDLLTLDVLIGDGATETRHYGPRGRSADVCTLESQHQRYHEESHKPMDRGDCQGSLHSS